MYKQFFNFNTEPFSIAPDPHFIYMSEQHQEGLAHLIYGINHGGGFVVLTGEVGTGKTTLCHCLLQELPDNVDIALALNPKLNAVELLASICDELQIVYDKDSQTLKTLVDNLNKYLLGAHASGRQTVLIIDEAQNLDLDALEQVRLLTNLETSKTKLLQIILIGQPELKEQLENPELRQLNQRITARYHLTPLSYPETQKYIKHRLSICGGNTELFTFGAVKNVFKHSKGIPRLINVICDKALLGAYSKGVHSVTPKVANQAAKEILNSTQPSKNTFFTKGFAGLIILTLITLGGGYYVYKHTQKNKSFTPALSIQKTDNANNNKNEPKQTKTTELPQEQANNRKKLPSGDFSAQLKKQNISLNTAISKLAKIWDKDIPHEFSCEELEVLGLICFFDKSDWKSIIALNRPAILEFPVSANDKAYALFLGLKEGNPIFQFDKAIDFPIAQVLSLWDGYYSLLWTPPTQDTKIIFPGQSSRSVLWIRKHIALTQDYHLSTRYSVVFDEDLKAEVIFFQKKHNLTPDGIVGPKTFIHLKNNDPDDNSPKLTLVP